MLTYKVVLITSGWLTLNLFVVACKKEDRPAISAPSLVYEATVFSPKVIEGIPMTFKGTVRAKEHLRMAFKMGGAINYLYDENVIVNAGTMLASTNATVVNAQSKKIKSTLDDIDKDLERLYELQKDSIGPLNKIEKLELKRTIQYANYKTVNHQVKEAKIHAPFRGYISKVFGKRGTQIAPMKPVIEFCSSTKIVSFFVSDEAVSGIELGQVVDLKFKKSIALLPVKGQVATIGFNPERNGLYKVEVLIKEALKVQEGFSVTVSFVQKQSQSVAVLPLRYVVQSNGTDSISAFVVNKYKAKEIKIPVVSQCNEGIVIPHDYAQFEYIAQFNELSEGVVIRNKE